MSLLITGDYGSANSLMAGVSNAAIDVRRFRQQANRQLVQAEYTQYSKLENELNRLYEECSHPDWNGDKAAPLSPETVDVAINVAASLPWDMPKPSLGCEADGSITLEWHDHAYQTLSVSVTANCELHYAALLGRESRSGTEIFNGEFPRRILELILEVFPRTNI